MLRSLALVVCHQSRIRQRSMHSLTGIFEYFTRWLPGHEDDGVGGSELSISTTFQARY